MLRPSEGWVVDGQDLLKALEVREGCSGAGKRYRKR